MKKVMIVLGLSLIVCSIILPGCKKKSEEEKVGDLLGKLDKAEKTGNEKEAERINKEIQELTDKQTREEKEKIKKIRAKMGQPLIFGQKDPFGEQVTRFSVTFESVSTTRNHPILSSMQKALAPKGEKYVVITAKLKNLGSREATPESNIEIKTSKGYSYGTGGGVLMSNPRYHPSSTIDFRGLKPGEEAWKLFWVAVSEDAVLVEITGILGGSGLLSGDTEFSLKLTQLR